MSPSDTLTFNDNCQSTDKHSHLRKHCCFPRCRHCSIWFIDRWGRSMHQIVLMNRISLGTSTAIASRQLAATSCLTKGYGLERQFSQTGEIGDLLHGLRLSQRWLSFASLWNLILTGFQWALWPGPAAYCPDILAFPLFNPQFSRHSGGGNCEE